MHSRTPRAGVLVVTFLIVLSTGCQSASQYRPPAPRASSTLPPVVGSQPVDAWSPGLISPYTVGRRVDPRDPSVVHESHTVYRREQSRHPNLVPPDWLIFPGNPSPPNPNAAGMLHDALTAELNQQRATSLALIEQAKALDAQLKRLDAQTREFRDAVARATAVQGQIQSVNSRIEALEGKLRTTPGSGAPAGGIPSR